MFLLIILFNFVLLTSFFAVVFFLTLTHLYCYCSQCSKPLLTINSWWTAHDTKFSSLSSWDSWRAANDTRHWWPGCYVTCHRSVCTMYPSFDYSISMMSESADFKLFIFWWSLEFGQFILNWIKCYNTVQGIKHYCAVLMICSGIVYLYQ